MAPPRFSAFTLVEVTLVIGLFTFGILSVTGLLAVSLDSQSEASTRAAAIRQLDNWLSITRKLPAGEMWSETAWQEGKLLSPIPNFHAIQSDALTDIGPLWISADGQPTTEADAAMRLEMEFLQASPQSIMVRADISWPAQAPSARVQVQAVTFLSHEHSHP